jgi:broad specificity phosphatase PhoE
MSRVVLIRHAQATLSGKRHQAFSDYDRLSPLGRTQADHLAEELVSSGVGFDRVYVGPSRRHRETAEAVRAAFERAGRPWPGEIAHEGFAEHDGASVVQRALDTPDFDDRLVELRARSDEATESERLKIYFRAFRHVLRRWAREELPDSVDGGESWADFRARVRRGVEDVLASVEPRGRAAVFTSGGPVGSAVAWCLELGDEAALELAWTLQNATLTELVRRNGRTTLERFNAQPRISASDLHTYV